MIKKIIISTLLLISSSALAANYQQSTANEAKPSGITWGFSLAYGGFGKLSVPDNTQGFRAAITMQPNSFRWGNLNLYFDLSFARWHTNHKSPKELYTVIIAPVLRYYFVQGYYSPYIEGSIGAGYISKKHFGGRKLGSNFTFQDMVGLGMAFGKKKNFAASINFLHYSHAGIGSKHNSGITVPLLFKFDYRF